MRKKLSSYMTSRYILIAVTVVCIIFVSTSFFTDSLVAPLRNAVSMVVVPLQKGMNNLGLWTYDKVTTLQEIWIPVSQSAWFIKRKAKSVFVPVPVSWRTAYRRKNLKNAATRHGPWFRQLHRHRRDWNDSTD